jgi:hypothetical protein
MNKNIKIVWLEALIPTDSLETHSSQGRNDNIFIEFIYFTEKLTT